MLKGSWASIVRWESAISALLTTSADAPTAFKAGNTKCHSVNHKIDYIIDKQPFPFKLNGRKKPQEIAASFVTFFHPLCPLTPPPKCHTSMGKIDSI